MELSLFLQVEFHSARYPPISLMSGEGGQAGPAIFFSAKSANFLDMVHQRQHSTIIATGNYSTPARAF